MDVSQIFSCIFGLQKLKAGCLSKNWYEEKNHLDVYNSILSLTSFLDEYNPTLRERIFYLQKDYKTAILCPFCNSKFLRLKNVKFLASCGSEECEFARKSSVSKKIHAEMDEEKKKLKNLKIASSNSISLDQRYKDDPTKLEKIKHEMSVRALGRKQTVETKKKRYETRKRNGRLNLTEEQKRKISESNRKTHSSKEFREKHKETYQRVGRKISAILKEKIAKGTFTPNITNSWTHWAAFYKFQDGTTKKFRSTWEAIFFALNPKLEYETLRVKYKNSIGEDCTYIVDFVDHSNRVAFEIKPSSMMGSGENLRKHQALLEWARENDYLVEVIDEDWLRRNVNQSVLDNQPHLLKGFETIGLSKKYTI